MHTVLRLQPGERVTLLDNSGWEYTVELTAVSANDVQGQVVGRSVKANEPRTKITLYQSVLKGSRFEWALQKGTELGVSEFVPVIASRCILQNLADAEAKFPRWQRVILEAAEQCGRAKFPALLPALMFAAACERAGDGKGLALMPWEEETAFTLKWMLRPQGRQPALQHQPPHRPRGRLHRRRGGAGRRLWHPHRDPGPAHPAGRDGGHGRRGGHLLRDGRPGPVGAGRPYPEGVCPRPGARAGEDHGGAETRPPFVGRRAGGSRAPLGVGGRARDATGQSTRSGAALLPHT